MPHFQPLLATFLLAHTLVIADKMSTMKLTYFDFGGRAEYTRLACVIGGIDFENHLISFEQFGQMKASGELPHGQVPILEIDGVKYPQSNSQLRYVGKLAGLYPEDPLEALRVDAYVDFAEDMAVPVGATISRKRFGLPDFADEDEKKAAREQLAFELLPPLLQQLEKKLADNGTGWCVGDSCTIADLRWYQPLNTVLSGTLDYVPPSILDAYPLAKGLVDKVKSIPAVHAWYEAEAARKASSSS
uniref:Glutathione transferase n=1 Tax=Pinguiococcus pyrenoidosus TaxID=172671 RepID=A0A7R9UBX0_9STRA|mmetsp:Transcript_4835/g.19354  ORF Transcript_4835/g.19354 Transcript_4835/m.19354 type:complete len:245 (+) Transcript_4835:17-751(+)|eukprot:scaffold48_cov311-Pinguiococcus_pyrenoidosus.AAC.182